MAQKTFTSAMLTSADVNLYLAGEGGAWQSWSPVVTQSVNVTVTNTRSRFARWGRLIIATADLTVTGTGTASNAVTLSLPVTSAATGPSAGNGSLFDNSANLNYNGAPFLNTTTTVSLLSDGGAQFLGLSIFTAALAVNDIIRFAFIYESAA